jgi:hypothetical protein
MAKTIAKVLGVVLLAVGVLGFFVPHAAGAHLSVAHNVIHLVTGALALWFGMRASLAAAKTFDVVFGAVYGLLGVAGFALGAPGSLHLAVIPGTLELGLVDHVIHVALGAAFLIGGLVTHPVRTLTPSHR